MSVKSSPVHAQHGRVHVLILKTTVAEKSFKLLTALSSQHPSVRCIAVSHSSREATDRWVVEVGGAWDVDVVVDEERDAYAAWGLGLSSTWHAIGPTTLYSAYKLGTGEGIWSRTTQSGSRWQTGGFFAVDPLGIVRWAHVAKSADDLPDFGEALEALEPAAITGARKPGE